MSTDICYVPRIGRVVKFKPRSEMRSAFLRRAPGDTPSRATPSTPLPVDSSGGLQCPWPMDGNNTYGDCGPAMMAHLFGTLTFGQGKPGFAQWVPDVKALESQYLQISGGDNGTDEPMLVGPGGACVAPNGLAGDPAAIVVDSLDFDVTDVPLTQYLIDQFYSVQMAWSVPDYFINQFATGVKFLGAEGPDPNNGHFVPLVDVSTEGLYTLVTWGTYCFVDPAFVASVQPECFVSFSPLQFSNASGLDSKGRHVTVQAAKWAEIGGNPIPQSVIAAFPPAATPGPTPIPVPVPNPPSPVTLGSISINLDTRVITAPPGFTLAPAATLREGLSPSQWIALIEQFLSILGPFPSSPAGK